MSNLFIVAAVLALLMTCPTSYAVEVHDPTKPTAYRESVQSNKDTYRLESILLGVNRKLAIINGESFSEGDTHKLGKVISINRNNVVLQGSKRHILTLTTLSLKKPVDKK